MPTIITLTLSLKLKEMVAANIASTMVITVTATTVNTLIILNIKAMEAMEATTVAVGTAMEATTVAAVIVIILLSVDALITISNWYLKTDLLQNGGVQQ